MVICRSSKIHFSLSVESQGKPRKKIKERERNDKISLTKIEGPLWHNRAIVKFIRYRAHFAFTLIYNYPKGIYTQQTHASHFSFVCRRLFTFSGNISTINSPII